LLLHDKERYAVEDFPYATTENFIPQEFKRDIAAGMLQLANAILVGDCTADEITPFCVEAIYRSAVFFGREYSRTGALSEAASSAAIKDALNVIGKRWKAACKLLIFEAQRKFKANLLSFVCSND
jgi:hypothetical protein